MLFAVEFSRRVVRLDVSERRRRREIPIDNGVDAALSALSGRRAERLMFSKAAGASPTAFQ
jgi:hypothetical protein